MQVKKTSAVNSLVICLNTVLLFFSLLSVLTAAGICIFRIEVSISVFVFVVLSLFLFVGLISIAKILFCSSDIVNVLGLIDRQTNCHNIAVNSYELAEEGRVSVFADMSIEKGLELLRHNRDLKLTLDKNKISVLRVMICCFSFVVSILMISGGPGMDGFELTLNDDGHRSKADKINTDDLNLGKDSYQSFEDNEEHHYSRSNAQDLYESEANDNAADKAGGVSSRYGYVPETESGNPVTTSVGNSFVMPEIDAVTILQEYMVNVPENISQGQVRQVHIENRQQDIRTGFSRINSSSLNSGNLVAGGIGGNSVETDSVTGTKKVLGKFSPGLPEPYLIDRLGDPVREVGFSPAFTKDKMGFGLFGTVKRDRSKALVLLSDIVPMYIKGISHGGTYKVYNISLPSGAAGGEQVGSQIPVGSYDGSVDKYFLSERWKKEIVDYYDAIR